MAQQEKDKKRGKWGEGLMFDPVQINKLYTFIKSKANGRSTKHMSQKRTANVIENKVGFALIPVLPPSTPSSLCFFCCCPCSACNASCCTQVALSVATAAPSPGYAATQPLISFASYSPPSPPSPPLSSPSLLVSFSFSEKAKRRMKIAFN